MTILSRGLAVARLLSVFFVVLSVFAADWSAQAAPAQCQTGVDANTSSPWVVCSADANTAWISANDRGTYNALAICNSLGYATVSRYGGTCGNVCGYCQGATSCSSPGNKTFDGGGGPATNLRITVQWECSGALVLDTTPPVLNGVPVDITVNMDPGQPTAVVTYTPPTATDDTDGAITPVLTAGLASGAAFPLGTTTVTYTATDAAGNSASASFTVTVNDNEAPVITVPADITVNTDAGQPTAIVSFAVSASDNVGLTAGPTLTAGLASGSAFPIGTTTVTFQGPMLREIRGRQASRSRSITTSFRPSRCLPTSR